MTKTGAKNLEEREASRTITIKYLNDVALALEPEAAAMRQGDLCPRRGGTVDDAGRR